MINARSKEKFNRNIFTESTIGGEEKLKNNE